MSRITNTSETEEQLGLAKSEGSQDNNAHVSAEFRLLF